MKQAELERISSMLKRATTPEEIFGKLAGGTPKEQLEAGRAIFRQVAKVTHPDLYAGTDEWAQANLAFTLLARFWEQAQAKIAGGTYGAKADFAPFTLQTATTSYTVERLLARGDICALYAGHATGSGPSILKIPLQPGDNDLLANEARILKHLQASEDYAELRYFISQLVESFAYQEKSSGITRQINVLKSVDGLYSLKEVRAAYRQGVDPRDMAWMWRRLLVALGFAHASGVIHGAVLPPHILIQPRKHGVVLIDWSYAVREGERISAISSEYRAWYPAEVFAHEEPLPGLDIAMAARCMFELLGGDPLKQTLPESVPWQLASYLQGCTLANPRRRPQDAQRLLSDFDALIARLWGPRTFREFIMPLP
jgi:serine/threonine protein kinase